MRALIRRIVDHILGCRSKQVARRRDENPSYRKHGGYASQPRPVNPLPKVPRGPAPGAKPRDLYGWSGTPDDFSRADSVDTAAEWHEYPQNDDDNNHKEN